MGIGVDQQYLLATLGQNARQETTVVVLPTPPF